MTPARLKALMAASLDVWPGDLPGTPRVSSSRCHRPAGRMRDFLPTSRANPRHLLNGSANNTFAHLSGARAWLFPNGNSDRFE